MKAFDLFSRRQAMQRGEVPDVYKYGNPPQALRVQMVYIASDAIGNQNNLSGETYKIYANLVGLLHREYGTLLLAGSEEYEARDATKDFLNFLLNAKGEQFVDGVELMCRAIDVSMRHLEERYQSPASLGVDDAIALVNRRLQQHAYGYRFEAGYMVRVDSELVHAEVIKPALALLHDKRFQGAHDEFQKAHEHYRHGRTKEAMSDCVKALESTLKTICSVKKWAVNKNATAVPLLAAVFDNGLIPEFWKTHFGGLRSMLEAGVPTVRNKMSGHGQGVELMEVPEHIAAFAIHQTAAAIVFLVRAMEA